MMIGMSGSSMTERASLVSRAGAAGMPRSVVVSRSAIATTSIGRPARRAISARWARSTFTTPAPIVPKPISPTLTGAATLRGCERIPSRRRAADASRRAALLLLAIASGYDSSSRLARRAPRPPGSVRGFIHNLSRLVGQDRHARDRARAAQVVGKADLRALHLPRAGLAAELCRELVDHAHAGRAHRVAVRLEPARGIHRLLAAEIGAPLLDEPAALAARAEAQVLVVQDLGDGEAVVHLGEVDLRWRHLRLRVGLLGGAHRGLEAEVVEARLVVGLARDRREPDAQGPHRR